MKTSQNTPTKRSSNRAQQARYLSSVLEHSGTHILSTIAPEKFEELQMNWEGEKKENTKVLLQYAKIKDEFEAELSNFSQYMKLSEGEAAIWIAVMSYYLYNGVSARMYTSDVVDYFDMQGINVLVVKEILDDLCDKSYVVHKYDREIFYAINQSVLQSLQNNDREIEVPMEKQLDVYGFCSIVSKFIEYNQVLNDLCKETTKLENMNKHIMLISKLKKHNLGIEERILFYEICDDLVQGIKSDIKQTCTDIFGRGIKCTYNRRRLCQKEHPLVVLGLIDILDSSYEDTSQMTLSEKGLDYAFDKADADLFKNEEVKSCKMTDCDAIDEREMFYSGKLSKDVSFVEDILTGDNLTSLQSRLKEKHMGQGVAMLFYGGPGTGKTETVMQLAKKTGRAVLQVDLSASKSCWYGESQKLIKKIFKNYSNLVRSGKRTPILLFNEADAVLGKRSDNPERSTDKTDNAIQNIILEEMEKLEGIMIATTNLEGNLDKAFERRFLLKVRFDKPSCEAKRSIWSSKIQGLDQCSYESLASSYDFSGGEIDNIARKATMEEVLLGEKPTLQRLRDLCERERISKCKTKIGF